MKYYVIICDSFINTGQKLYLVDRRKTKRLWWTKYFSSALLLKDKEAAIKITKSYSFNNVRIEEIDVEIK